MDWTALFAGSAAFTKALAWPLATIVGLYWYKPTVSRLLDRLVKGKIGPSGAEVEAMAPLQLNVETPQDEFKDQVKEIESGRSLPIPDPWLDSISRITVQQIERDFPDGSEGQKRWLIRMLSVFMAQHAHEQTHRMIFGSQLMLLYKINSAGGVLPLEQARPLYDQAKSVFPEVYRQSEFSDWIKFLQIRDLIESAELRGELAISITRAGTSYLQYIIDRRLPEKTVG